MQLEIAVARALPRNGSRAYSDPNARYQVFKLINRLRRLGFEIDDAVKIAGMNRSVYYGIARAMRENGHPEYQKLTYPRGPRARIHREPIYLETYAAPPRNRGAAAPRGEVPSESEPLQIEERALPGAAPQEPSFVIIMGRGNALAQAMATLKDFLK